MYKIIGADGQPYGPASLDQMRRWMAENRVHGQTLVQREGTEEWKPLNAWPELAELKTAPSPDPPPPGAAPPVAPISPAPGYAPANLAARASNKIPAGVCGILLGSLGVHKFILGYPAAGVIMLVVSLVGGPFTCGVSWGVMHLIGLIEGILYLCKTDEEFVRTYVDGRREWF
jgi:TM2 domain-containing membrane protein YozV